LCRRLYSSSRYYCSLVQFYTVYKLQRMAVPTVRLYLLCFASHRFRQINDNLIEAFIHLVDDYEQRAKIAAAESMADNLAKNSPQTIRHSLRERVAPKP
jgi:hypothetical protein